MRKDWIPQEWERPGSYRKHLVNLLGQQIKDYNYIILNPKQDRLATRWKCSEGSWPYKIGENRFSGFPPLVTYRVPSGGLDWLRTKRNFPSSDVDGWCDGERDEFQGSESGNKPLRLGVTWWYSHEPSVTHFHSTWCRGGLRVAAEVSCKWD